MIESTGQQLRQVRESRAVSLEQASRATHIRLHYLQALEDGRLDMLPSLVQARGFLRAYAAYLGLDAGSMLASLEDAGLTDEAGSGDAGEAKIDAPAVTSEPAEAIFIEIGERLAHQRKLLGLSLDDVERHTHLRQRYLQALESGDLSRLPSPVQGRGMLNNYAGFLGLDPEPLLLLFAQGLQAQLAARQAARPEPTRPAAKPVSIQEPRPPGALRRIFSGESLLAVLLVLFLGGFVIWGAVRIFSVVSNRQASPTAPSIAEVLLSADTPTATPTLVRTTPTPPPAPVTTGEPEATSAIAVLPGSAQGIQVYVTVRQRAWMRAIVDGETAFEGRVIPGSAYPYEGEQTVEILTGNGAALQIFFNQQDLGPMGQFGEVVHRIYTAEGVVTPTATVTRTPTETPRTTPTPGGAPSATRAPGIATAAPSTAPP
jgi:cytoskeletal protein RodZ